MNVSVVWLRRDLRLIDNEAVANAAAASKQCLFVFALDPWFFKQPEIGLLRVRFLFESLEALDKQLRQHGNRLVIVKGKSTEAVTGLLRVLRDDGMRPQLFYNHDIQTEYGRERDKAVDTWCGKNKVAVKKTHNYFLLHDESKMDDWWKQYYDYQYDEQWAMPSIPKLEPTIEKALAGREQLDARTLANDMSLDMPTATNRLFVGGEAAAHHAVYSFLKDRVDGYSWKISRPYLAQTGATSLIAPHLTFGTVSNRTVFQAAALYRSKLETKQPKKAFDIATYMDRLRWRDSFTQRLWFKPELIWKNRFAEFNDIYNQDALNDQQLEYFERWKAGETGFPLLDAAMRQLKADGFINFRMRAMAATFLSINCGVSWHHGATHFMNHLVDGDIAINHWQWQMQAGITNPLSPTFRMYSPTKNFRDRDPQADYVHFWLPETMGQDIETVLKNAKPMLDFAETRATRGKLIADTRARVRERIIAEKGSELRSAETAHRVVTNYNRYSADRYKRYTKPPRRQSASTAMTDPKQTMLLEIGR